MAMRLASSQSETQKKRSLLRRMIIVHGVLLFFTLTIVARLIELQVVKGKEYREAAETRHYRTVSVKAKRGEILGVDSKSHEKNIFATNTTLDLVYVDPVLVNPPKKPSNATLIAETLADILVTPEYHTVCTQGKEECPRELISLYEGAFDPILKEKLLSSGSLLEPIPQGGLPPTFLKLPDLTEARRQFARQLEEKISETRVTYSPLKYGATKTQMKAAMDLHLPGITISEEQKLVYANPEEVQQASLSSSAIALGRALQVDSAVIKDLLRARPLRYVPVMRKLPPSLSLRIKEAQLSSLKEAIARQDKKKKNVDTSVVDYALKGIALIPEHWRFYPDTSIASHVIGFMNTNGEAQYGVERTYNPQLRGQEGVISTVNDPQGGQILTSAQTIVDAKDGDTVVLTIDRTIQKHVENLMETAVKRFKADSGQAIIMDPNTGRILAMVNAPLFDSNKYAQVYEKEVIGMDDEALKNIVVELFHPQTNGMIVRAYINEVFTSSGRTLLPEKPRKVIEELEKQYDLRDLTRYYRYISDTNRREIFPTDDPKVWLKFKNDIGVGAYLNRTVQEIYEPGSVMKPITMAIALDQGEVVPGDMYNDSGPVEIDDFTIKNSLLKYYGRVSMIDCLAYSINTCMTSVSEKLGAKLFYTALDAFGFGKITGIELEDELAGEMHPWREWSRAQLATVSFGQGISATPLQVITAWSALANGGKLMKPTIIDSVEHTDGTVDVTQPQVVEQVISPKSSETITAMITASSRYGFAKTAKIPGYLLAGKTGTSQIAKGNGYESGTGSTIATFAGYAPVRDPKFVILIKLDRPKTTIYGVDAAAPMYKDITKFLFDYYGIPPDEKK